MITYSHRFPPETIKYKDLDWITLGGYFTVGDSLLIMKLDNLVTIGYVMYKDNHIYMFEIKKEYQKKGYGTKLIEKYETLMDEYEIISLTPKNRGAEKFYISCGYEKDLIGCREMFKLIGDLDGK